MVRVGEVIAHVNILESRRPLLDGNAGHITINEGWPNGCEDSRFKFSS